jgi:hypothetical protein
MSKFPSLGTSENQTPWIFLNKIWVGGSWAQRAIQAENLTWAWAMLQGQGGWSFALGKWGVRKLRGEVGKNGGEN